MPIVCLHDKAALASFLRRNRALYAYALGDLDDFFWPYTQWYGLQEAGEIREVCLLYTGAVPPTLHALTGEQDEPMRALLQDLLPLLPSRFDAHVSGDLSTVLGTAYDVSSRGEHIKMALVAPECLARVDASQVVTLGSTDLPAVLRLYDVAYPGNWFDARMLATGFYRGVWHGDELVSVAGIHTYSPEHGVAALGNITTHPAWRGRGLASVTTAALCRALLERVELIGLNVKAGNSAAIATYRRLGFAQTAAYEECALVLRP